ncbi:MAG: MerR family transcriptional regulator [Gammaproteobacteria bacterium]|nr:MerR family transcriptional regulator [Gammaproteobacteria bacterium]MDH4310596.1 MerR family transcriptional regulator [Gammaproteobacteria bacterium]MDH5272630.1 MerR family transcriptional regulator [Gammaproteobacteria bacterium]
MYSIKAVAQATGLTVETLRAWERRYRVVVPQRDDLGRRVYQPEDVLRLRRLREATERGHPIGRLAQLDEPGLVELLHEPGAVTPPVAAPSAFVQRILAGAERYSSASCEQALTLAISLLPPAQLIDEVLEPLLREVGERWHAGRFSIAQERMVSASVRRHIGLIVETYDRTARRQPIVFATLPGERHELGLLMSAMICASHGCKVHYLGPDLPAAEIARYSREVDAALVAISVILLESVPALASQLTVIRQTLGPDVPVWIGGQGARGIDQATLPPGCLVIADRAELEQRLDVLPR